MVCMTWLPLDFISDSSLQPVPLTLDSFEHLESREQYPSGVLNQLQVQLQTFRTHESCLTFTMGFLLVYSKQLLSTWGCLKCLHYLLKSSQPHEVCFIMLISADEAERQPICSKFKSLLR